MKRKFTEKSFIFYGINFIVGFGFIATIQSVIKNGNYSLLIFVITSFIAAAIMLAFARGTQYFGNQIGGSYAYAKEAFPKSKWFWFLNGWNQFMQAPLFSATSPLFFSTIASLFVNDEKYQILLLIISLIFFVTLTIISSFSLHISKKVILATAIIKWIVFALILGVIVYLVSTNPTPNLFTKNSSIQKITPFIIINSILSFIYAYGGIEGLAGLSTNVKTKNFKKILFYLFGFVIFIYLVFFLLFSFIPSFQAGQGDYVAIIMKNTLGTAGLIIFAIGLLFKQMTSTIFSMVYYSKTIVPLALDNFLPSSFAKVAKNNQHKNAIKFVTIISIFSMIIFTILPKLIGATDSFTTILSAGNLVFFVLYLNTLISILHVSFKRKEFKIPIWEKIFYMIATSLIIVILLISFIPPIINETYEPSQLLVILSYVSFMILGFIVWICYILIKRLNPLHKFTINLTKQIKTKQQLDNIQPTGINAIIKQLFFTSLKSKEKFILLTHQNEFSIKLIINLLTSALNFHNKINELPTNIVYKLNTEQLAFSKKNINTIFYNILSTKNPQNTNIILFIENINLLNDDILEILKTFKNKTNIKIIASTQNVNEHIKYNEIFNFISLENLSKLQKQDIILYAKDQLVSEHNLIIDNDVNQLLIKMIKNNMNFNFILNQIDNAAAYIKTHNNQWFKHIDSLNQTKINLEYQKIANQKLNNNKDVIILNNQIKNLEDEITTLQDNYLWEQNIAQKLILSLQQQKFYQQKIQEYKDSDNISVAYLLENQIIVQIQKEIDDLKNKIKNFQAYKINITKEIFLKANKSITI
ncbi:amino acid permease [Mycoplasma miroungirhinis]|uniref:Amino acid permease n=1 Tax=Mycoplasma miroungirhinis TaxID=754516 RepID=A0A6M4JDH8_9MOLU|nr:amino acid permease [Mycoplasma miroungirhinis]QJR44126.1 amino acid permease [Mycoplasma miroungirhinis]